MSALSYILQHKIVAIIRGAPPGELLSIAHALHKGGIRLLEITLNSENALGVIKELCDECNNDMLIGAGTVLSTEEAAEAINAGAQFIISPSTDPEVIATTKRLGKVSIPGAYTPTEIVLAHKCGADIIKVFPAPDAAYIKNILAPLNGLKLMPTGGVNIDNIAAYAAAGASAFGIGSSLVNGKEKITQDYLQQLEHKAKQLTNAIQNT
ncbi:MAG: bifunctional 4-hydroxy-2-oxoglutarate aldolase/2-dehydro-3-deoxy-phosphogluconate aldolase [Williamsia sp.]|nr:bifunctional 4-hydroxy-2-oxoglutarate aldolase/2-dehydro-3-deoxy-phosphogluconate aldolase [Williamsia sp.]